MTGNDFANKSKTSHKRLASILLTSVSVLMLTACGGGDSDDVASVDVSSAKSSALSGEAKVLIPSADGTATLGNELVTVDYSNASEGYIVSKYTGDSDKVKFQLTGPDFVTYTFNLNLDEETVLPLSAGGGEYNITLFESIGGGQYATSLSETVVLDVTNPFGTYLYPNQYVDFSDNTKAVAKASELVKGASCDLEAVARVYDYVVNNVVYDKEEAENVASNYLPVVDEVMDTGKGICFDYASLMAAMLRSQGIPTRLEIGYAKDAYHAWISVYTEDEGWIGGVIQFNGTSWTLMDPTLAANSKSSSKIKEFIGDGSSYTIKYKY